MYDSLLWIAGDKDLNKYPERFCLFAGSGDDPEHIEEAKKYVKKHGLTSEDVKIISNGEQVLVVTKREIELK